MGKLETYHTEINDVAALNELDKVRPHSRLLDAFTNTWHADCL